eukprot:6174410-Pleurochrysis_carterae.AAC.7
MSIQTLSIISFKVKAKAKELEILLQLVLGRCSAYADFLAAKRPAYADVLAADAAGILAHI